MGIQQEIYFSLIATVESVEQTYLSNTKCVSSTWRPVKARGPSMHYKQGTCITNTYMGIAVQPVRLEALILRKQVKVLDDYLFTLDLYYGKTAITYT